MKTIPEIKRTAKVILILIFCNCNSILAQLGFEITPLEFDENYINVDISNDQEDFPMNNLMENTSEDTLEVKWIKEIEDCPDSWDIFISDKDFDYLPQVLTNPTPITLYPNEKEVRFIVHVFPRTIEGCCKLKVIFTDFADENQVYDTVNYSVRINNELCTVTNTDDINENLVKVELYPNPVESFVSLISEEDYNRIELYNTNGELIKVFNKNMEDRYNLTELNRGIYSLLVLRGNTKIRTFKIFKE